MKLLFSKKQVMRTSSIESSGEVKQKAQAQERGSPIPAGLVLSYDVSGVSHAEASPIRLHATVCTPSGVAEANGQVSMHL